MMLTLRGIQRFYNMWFPLLHFVSQHTGLVPHFPSTYGEGNVLPTDATTLRNALWANDSLRTMFIAENPVDFSADDLAQIKSWDARVSGNFYVLRQLKKHAILIPERGEPRAYGVLGLSSSIGDIVPIPPPCLIETTLIPFEGKIIYDSLMACHNVFFGSGIRSSLNETYKTAQEHGTLLTSLVSSEGGAEGIRARNAKLIAAFQSHITRTKVSEKTIQSHRATIERFAEDELLSQHPPRGLIDVRAMDLASYLGNKGDDVNLTSFKHFVRFLRDSGRASWQDTDAMLKELR